MSSRRGLTTAVLLCLVGAVVVLPGEAAVELTTWPWGTAAGGLLLALAGLLTVVRGRSWAALGQALDRGEDPTANLGTLAGAPADREADRT